MTPILFDFARKSGFTLCKEESALREMLEQFAKFIIEHEAAKQHDNDPVAWATAVGSHAHISWGKNRPDYPIRYEVPLYTTPPAAPVQEPVAWMHWLNGPCRVWMNKDEAMMELDRLNREYPVDSHARKMRPLVFGDTTPPAAPVQDDPDEQVIRERDEAEAIADALAEKIAAITGCEIGEHTSANSPWHSALDAADEFLASRPPAQAAPVQEPVAWREFDGEGGYTYFAYENNETWRDDYIERNGEKYADWVEPLYTTPPAQPAPVQEPGTLNIDRLGQWLDASLKERAAQRQWVGLTDDERKKLWRDVVKWGDPSHDDVDLMEAIEAKLKEKNT